MKATFFRVVCRILAVSLIVLPLQVQAGMVGTGEAIATSASQADRAVIESQMQALGVSPQAALDRVAALTNAEVADLRARIDSLPAGGIAGVLPLIVVALLIYYLIVVPSTKEAAPAKK